MVHKQDNFHYKEQKRVWSLEATLHIYDSYHSLTFFIIIALKLERLHYYPRFSRIKGAFVSLFHAIKGLRPV